jgi:hypothetical protein
VTEMSKRKQIAAIALFFSLLLVWAILQAAIAGVENDQHDRQLGERLTTIASDCYYISDILCTENTTCAVTKNTHQSSDLLNGHVSTLTVTTATPSVIYENYRGVFHNEIYPRWVERQGWIDRVTHYCRCMGMNVTDEDIAYFTDLAIQGGYDPRLWCCIAMAESTGGRGSANYYGFCGGSRGPWAYVPGSWRTQTEWLHSRFTTFYSQYVDISQPENVLFFHYRGDPVTYDPRQVFYVDNVMTWLENI